MIAAIMDIGSRITAPWVFVVVCMATGTAVALMFSPGMDEAGFTLGAILVGGFLAKALLTIPIQAFRTCLLMVAMAFLLILAAAYGVDPAVFKQAAMRELVTVAGGGVLVVIGALLERHKQ